MSFGGRVKLCFTKNRGIDRINGRIIRILFLSNWESEELTTPSVNDKW